MRAATPALFLTAILSWFAGPLAAQQGAGPRTGWIGITLDVPVGWTRQDDDAPTVIGEVHRGSPAEQAGLRAGDRLLAVGELDSPDDFRNLPERLPLAVGERVRVRVEREGRQYDVELQAAERPASLRPRTIRLAMEPDSIVEEMVRAMDSLRLQLMRISGDTERVARESATRVRVVRDERSSSSAFTAPFEFFVFRSEEHDSLREAMEELSRTNVDLKRQEQARLVELRALRRGPVESDAQLQAVRIALEDVSRRSAELRTAMSEAARANAGYDYRIPAWVSQTGPDPSIDWPAWPWTTPETPSEPEPQAAPQPQPVTFRPLTPYLVGSNRVAGAQVIELKPELARYFGVESGVLVVDVAPGTPAAMAGMVPGDVITRLDKVGVRSVEELRVGVTRSGETLPVSLVRQGSTLQVLLRRR